MGSTWTTRPSAASKAKADATGLELKPGPLLGKAVYDLTSMSFDDDDDTDDVRIQRGEREVRDFFGDIVFSTVIPRDVAVSEAPSHAQSVIDYAPRARGARAYVELCMEVLHT